jgi:hypothetical protein
MAYTLPQLPADNIPKMKEARDLDLLAIGALDPLVLDDANCHSHAFGGEKRSPQIGAAD